ncbi:MAG: putative lipid II flippase FtsW [Muribaculaceae bacterium]|nr:putative lipid II flippase FtsW [Roseburia sp.]MCM1430601.1 putative lipid II flippase FtsW [Muribaculaceae bacterium]MCM1492708.1 putative lipid II flippase FtsW [Muribaculaceae bacterium]
MAKRKRLGKSISYFDYNLLFLIIFLLCFGLVMVYSSSSYTSLRNYGDGAYYLKLQLRNILLGLIPMVFLAKVDYRVWKKFGTIAYIGSLGLCLLVFVPQFNKSSHGSSRWLEIGPVSFQPSEIAKLAVILFMAVLVEKISKQMGDFATIIKIVVIMAPLLAVVAISNLSTAVIIFGIIVCMLFVASPKYLQFILVAAVGLVFIVLFIRFAGYRSGRVQAWLHPETATSDDVYQTTMGLYAIGSGGLFGKGLGESLQKMGNVPESQNDMIFTIICEELGLFGAVCVILLFVLLIWRMMVIANNAQDLFGALLVTGVMSHIAIQVILNIAVVTNTIPNTGVILPFISYGGTSLIFLMGELGLVLSVSRGIRLEKID